MEAREIVADLEQRLPDFAVDSIWGSASVYLVIAQAELALAEGRAGQIALDRGAPLPEAVGALRPTGRDTFFRGSEVVARLWEEQGDLDEARRVLELASQQKNRTYPDAIMYQMPTHTEWMRVRWKLAQINRKLGRLADARAIEDELRDLLVYADPDLWLLRQLQALQEADAGSAQQ